jgi:hypothetical protein
MAYWFAKRPNYRQAEQEYHKINAKWHPLFLFKFENKTVRILDKAGNWESSPADTRRGHWTRAELYRKFFELTCNFYNLDQEGILALSVHDGAHNSEDFPFFSFQKKVGERAILLPDIDAIGRNFYLGQHDDVINYFEKLNSAIFVGSTTGDRHTRESVTALSNQRIRSGVFFGDKPDVVFRLPLIRQCVSNDVEDMIRALGFGTGKTSWDDQLKHRFLISIDGNGATCSRVSIALKSNSVLLKYNSNSHLYYFPALVPGVHFVPISDDPDVISVINAEKNAP